MAWLDAPERDDSPETIVLSLQNSQLVMVMSLVNPDMTFRLLAPPLFNQLDSPSLGRQPGFLDILQNQSVISRPYEAATIRTWNDSWLTAAFDAIAMTRRVTVVPTRLAGGVQVITPVLLFIVG